MSIPKSPKLSTPLIITNNNTIKSNRQTSNKTTPATLQGIKRRFIFDFIGYARRRNGNARGQGISVPTPTPTRTPSRSRTRAGLYPHTIPAHTRAYAYNLPSTYRIPTEPIRTEGIPHAGAGASLGPCGHGHGSRGGGNMLETSRNKNG